MLAKHYVLKNAQYNTKQSQTVSEDLSRPQVFTPWKRFNMKASICFLFLS